MERRRGIERTRAMWAAVKDVALKEIVKLDEHLFDFFGKRLKETHFIGKAKTHLGESVVDPKRREEVLNSWEQGFQRRGFQPGTGTKIGTVVLEVFENEQQVARDRGDYIAKK